MGKRDIRDRNQSTKAKADEDTKSSTDQAVDNRQSDAATEKQAEQPKERRDDSIKPHLRCPCCWNGYGGKAARRKWQRQVSGPLVQRCYLCDQCGAEWVVDVRVELIDGIDWVETKVSKIRPAEAAPGDAA